MFDLNWYKQVLYLVLEGTKSAKFCPMTIAQFKSHKYDEKADNYYDVGNISKYLKEYLIYFNLEFKEQFYTKICNNNHVWVS